MGRTAFTPGPWFVQPQNKYDRSIAIIASDDPLELNHMTRGMVAYVTTEVATGNARYAHANAALIAAAPELFEALKHATDALTFCRGNLTEDGLFFASKIDLNIKTARAALIKALPSTPDVERT